MNKQDNDGLLNKKSKKSNNDEPSINDVKISNKISDNEEVKKIKIEEYNEKRKTFPNKSS